METTARDVALVRAAQSGERFAHDRLMDVWLPQVMAWCARLGGPRVDAEDAAHDVMVTVITKLESLRDPEKFASWTFGITRRVLAGHRRKQFVQRWVPGLSLDPVDPAEGPFHRASFSQLSRQVQRALESLSPAQREVLVLCDLEERTDLEAAQMLGIPLGTCKSRLRVARQKFRRATRHIDPPGSAQRSEHPA